MHGFNLESRYGVPTVSIHTDRFAKAVRQVAFTRGMPGARMAFVPMPVMGKTPAELRAYVEGNDPLTGRPVMEEVIEALLSPVSEEELRGVSFNRGASRLVEPGAEDNLHELFLANGWTDKLPIVLPTEERVQAMLAQTSHRPDEIVGQLRPTSTREAWEFSVEKVAVNAVMAGCRPEYFPVVLAMASSCVSARGSTTSSMAAMAVVNGPIRREIGMNWGIGALAPYNHANATIGRAYGLLSQNLQGGSEPGQTYLGSQGNNYMYNSLTYAENEEASPWEPFSVSHGFSKDDSAVSLFTGCRSTSFTLGLREKHWRTHVQNLLRGFDPYTPPTLILDPIAAKQFVTRGGFKEKGALEDWIHETATMPAKYYWDYQLIQNYVLPRALNGVEPYATKLAADPDALIPMFRREDINVVVVGGETNGYWRMMSCLYQTTVSVDKWR